MEIRGRSHVFCSFYYLFILVLILCGKEALCDEKKVFEEVIEAHHYNTKVRPRHNHSETVAVDVEFELIQIQSLDQKNQVLTFSGFIVAQWQDEYLLWNPDSYGGTTNIVIPPSNIWLPDFGIINSADTFYQTTFSTDFRVHVNHTGHILWSFGGNFATTCELDLTYFPFDRQMCNVTMENWAYDNEEVALTPHSPNVHLDDFHTNGEWDLEQTSAELHYIYHKTFPGKPYPKLTYNIYLKRKAAYYGLNIMAPCFYIIAVALAIFWLPAEAGEKVGVGVTVLLAFSVFQLVIADNSPKTSDFFPILSTYVTFVMGMSAFSTTTAIISLYFHHHLANRPVPKTVKIIFFKFLGRVLCMKDSIPDLSAESDTNSISPENAKRSESSTSFVKGEKSGLVDLEGEISEISEADAEIIKHLKFVTDQMKKQDKDAAIEDEWKALARVIDRCFFFFCLLIIVIVCLTMLTQQQPPIYIGTTRGSGGHAA